MRRLITMTLIFVALLAPETKANDQAELPGGSIFHSQSLWRKTDGKEASLKALSGSPTLVAMLYTSCPTACPMTIGDMKQLGKELTEQERSKIKFAMLSLDSEKDTPKALEAFAKKMNLNDRWTLLSPKSQADSSEVAGLLGVRYKKLPDGHYVHSNVIFLLNESGEIVAKKEGLNSESVEFVSKMKAVLSKK